MKIQFNKADIDTLLIKTGDCNVPFKETKDFYIEQFEIKPLQGYIIPIDEETGDAFPNCCPYHRQALEELNDWYINFPDCCDQHKALIGKWWFKKSNYELTPLKVVTQLSYTAQAIDLEIDKDDWFESISEYIEYNILSFGTPAVCVGNYLNGLKTFLTTQTKKNYDKINRIVKHIDDLYKPRNKAQEDFSLKSLYDIYLKWLKIFPFEISYFRDLKAGFENQFPFLNGKVKTNRYSGFSSQQALTRLELMNTLTIKTKQLLNSINSADLVKKGVITDSDKHIFDLTNENHRIKQSKLVGEFDKIEKEYIVIIHNWLSNERQYFEDISSYFKTANKSEGKSILYPIINPEIIGPLNQILNHFFSIKDRPFLEDLLKTGINNKGEKLTFMDQGNRFTDAFKQLKEKDLITGCQKKDLENWIFNNFMYLKDGKQKLFTADYLGKCISTNSNPCKNPLFYIHKGEIIKK